MRRQRIKLETWFFLSLTLSVVTGAELTERVFVGMADASAAAEIGGGRIVVACDETNTLLVYSLLDKTGLPVAEVNLTEFLDAPLEKSEADIEGCTRVGDIVYWIGSHGRNKNGKWRDMRYRLFATRIIPDHDGNSFTVTPLGLPTAALLDGLLQIDSLNLREHIGVVGETDERLEPKKGGLNIEAISASENGDLLYLGLENPRPQNKAVLLPLGNFREMVKGGESAVKPEFGEPILFDFEGLGFRAMEFSPFHNAFIIVAGAHDSSEHRSVIYRWNGNRDSVPVKIQEIMGLNLESVVVNPVNGNLRLFSDDGSMMVKTEPSECVEITKEGMCENSEQTDKLKQHFRMVELVIPSASVLSAVELR